MNDFSELENELKALRPAQPSPVLFERIEEAMGENCTASVAAEARGWRDWYRRFTAAPYKFAGGLAFAAVAVLLLLARINTDQTRNEDKEIAQVSPSSETRSRQPAFSAGTGINRSMPSSKFVPSGATQVVYNERNEGLHFADGSRQPLRRLRYQTQQTWQWRNPSTGASLRVSYPSEEVVLIPVSGQ
jgi:hypothetical protein